MIIIADSGSTKCDWLVLSDDWEIITQIKTMGYNPYFHSEYFIAADLLKYEFFDDYHQHVNEVYFYGAGCSSKTMSSIVFKALTNVFINANIQVEHDVKASALACYSGKEQISCILGTGSNSCFFDGENVKEGNVSLGFIVGDEASGSYFGKQILNAYFYGKLPEKLNQLFEKDFRISHAEFTAKVYADNGANVFLAQFAAFLIDNKEHPFFQKIIEKGIEDFIEKQICCYENYKHVEINFVGSIAFFLQEEIKEIGKKYDLSINQFIQHPVFQLMEYHKEKEIIKKH